VCAASKLPRLAVASDKVYQLLSQGRLFSPASPTTKTGRHDIAKSGVKHQNSKLKKKSKLTISAIDF
jgi:hypothetical protein